MNDDIRESRQPVTIMRDQDGFPAFDVRLEFDDWWILRTVTVTDPMADVDALVRAILSGGTTVTSLERSSGTITLSEPNGRRFLVGEWSTWQVSDAQPREVVCMFADDGEYIGPEVFRDEVDRYSFHVPTDDEASSDPCHGATAADGRGDDAGPPENRAR